MKVLFFELYPGSYLTVLDERERRLVRMLCRKLPSTWTVYLNQLMTFGLYVPRILAETRFTNVSFSLSLLFFLVSGHVKKKDIFLLLQTERFSEI